MRFRFTLLYLILFLFSCKSPNSNAQQSAEHEYTNHLIDQSSPYLLQHAHNPVDWHPWGEEALKKAEEEDKMILISVGYAACHWCHVMEEESFEDTAVARIMNENFVSIKVDREERPDIDDIYMTACHMATGKSCGWPLNAFALPNGQPVWAGTYFPKKNWVEILEYFIDIKNNEPEKLQEYAAQLTEGIQENERIEFATGDKSFLRTELDQIADTFLGNVDFKRGGRNGNPKFPMPNNWEFLLNYHHLSGDTKALKAVDVTLENMAMGGIYDHLGGGFARYSVDADWKVPHFEKMLYDNGQLVSIYAKAYQLTKNPLYKKIIEETLDFVSREMTSPEGGFYSSYDADSEGEEGKFYVWEKAEIDSILNDEQMAKIFAEYFEIKPNGNWEDTNILYRKKSTEDVAQKFKIGADRVEDIITKAKTTLFEAREKRVKPGLDDKILTSWNALMLKGYTDAYRTFGKQEYLDAALKNAAFIEKNMLQEDNRLNRNYKDGKSVINAFLDDYALLLHAYIALYEVTFDESWLFKAQDIAEYAIIQFYNPGLAMFNYTSKIDPPLIARKMEVDDNVIPGSNSTMARALLYLGTYLDNPEFLEKAKQMMHNMKSSLLEAAQPNFYSNWCILYQDLVNPPYEVAIIGENYEAFRKDMMENFLPNALFLGGKEEGKLKLLENKKQEGETMIYVCQNKVCKLPVTEVEKALSLMD
jgi:hypothetical protein